MDSHKKAMGPLVAASLLLAIAVVSVVAFQGWFNLYSSKTFTTVEGKADELNSVDIKSVVGGSLYVYFGQPTTVSDIKIGNISCNSKVSIKSSGIFEIPFGNCTSSFNTSFKDIVIITETGVFSEKHEVKNVQTYATCPSGMLVVPGGFDVDLDGDDESYFCIDKYERTFVDNTGKTGAGINTYTW